MKKIGIITLHRVLNYGSALQAYALQHYIEKTYSVEVELIDYVYPNVYHKKNAKQSLYKKVKGGLRRALKENLLERRLWKKKKFKRFYEEYYHLSKESFSTIESIESTKPQYDLYITGSDQVWNVYTLYNDPVFYCSFAPSLIPRISFGASFSVSSLPQTYEGSIHERLNKYSHIGVRESSAIKIIENLNINPNIDVKHTCDPTLLLERQDYDQLAEKSDLHISGEYILVYKLEYAYKAEPAMSIAISEARKKFKCRVVMIGCIKTRLEKNDIHVYGLGPCEFLWLFKNAKAIVTSSFHGSIFSVIYRKPFISVVPPKSHGDSRITDFLIRLGLENHILYNSQLPNAIEWQYIDKNEKLDCVFKEYIDKSKTFLHDALIATLEI